MLFTLVAQPPVCARVWDEGGKRSEQNKAHTTHCPSRHVHALHYQLTPQEPIGPCARHPARDVGGVLFVENCAHAAPAVEECTAGTILCVCCVGGRVRGKNLEQLDHQREGGREDG